MKVKVCGVTRFDQLEQLGMLNTDFAGLIFYKNSKRFIGDSLKSYKNQIKKLGIKKVGVFVNAGMDEITEAINDYGLDLRQLHGDEPVSFCKELASQIKLIKAFRVNSETDIESMMDNYRSACDYFLFDTLPDTGSAEKYGGTGKRFDWSILNNCRIGKPFFLSGGIRPEHIHDISKFNHPELFAIDINSGFETETGVKDLVQVEKFLNELRNEQS